jgi:pyruvate dehydrogenase E2 component (dihydrolipoamide acetyltransferase)
MAILVEMPKLSPTMEEGQIATWHAKEGDQVDVDDLLAEVETDKATMEFRSFDRGVLLKILAAAGSVVKLGDPVAIIGDEGEDISALLSKATQGAASAPGPAKEEAKAPAKEPAEEQAEEPAEEEASQPEAAAPAARPATGAPLNLVPPPPASSPMVSIDTSGRVKASPYVRKLARERGIDLRRVAGSGPGGRIVARDLDDAAAGTAAPAARPAALTAAATPVAVALPDLEPEVRRLSMMRKTIARRLTESKQTVPHFYLTIDVDVGALVTLREQLNADLATAPEPLKISYNDLIIKAAAVAITRAPTVNAQFTPEAIIYHRRVDISVAVAVEDGLVTPVVRFADRKSVAQIGAEVRDLAKRARDRKLAPEEMMNGTFSISNLGMYQIDEFAAVINPPEGAIMAVGAIRSEPVVVGDQVVAGKRMKVTLSCDHRVVDGAVGAQFLVELRAILEHPTQILAY